MDTYLKIFDFLFEAFLIWTCYSFGFRFEKFEKFQVWKGFRKFQKVQKFQIAHLIQVSSESFK